MNSRGIKRIGVVGSGIMGSGISQVAAQGGYEVIMMDASQSALDSALERIDRRLSRLVEKGQFDAARMHAIQDRITPTTNLADMAEGDFVIEAVPEVFDLKREVFIDLDRICAEHVILATNTSQFPITAIAAVTDRPDRVIGTHWFNPPPTMKLIEVIRGEATSDETLLVVEELAEKFGKEVVVCKKDVHGFITSRLILLWILEAIRIYDEGIADIEDIDKACRLGFNHPMGPFELVDFSGLDNTLTAVEELRDALGERFLAPESLRRMVNAGYVGGKGARGFIDPDS